MRMTLSAGLENNKSSGRVYEFYQESSGTGAQEYIYCDDPYGLISLMATLKIVSGSAKMQTTSSPIERVIAGTAEWIDQQDGAMTTTFDETFWNVTAIRMYVVSGSAVLFGRLA